MGELQQTPGANRLHIAVYGKRNAGKSSIINALSGQQAALVSEVAGTTTDPVYRPMELLPIGPVMLVDTAGLDDEGAIGDLRMKRTRQVMTRPIWPCWSLFRTVQILLRRWLGTKS